MAEPFDGVEQGQLRARMRELPTHNEPGTDGVAAVGHQAGELGDLRRVPQVALGSDDRDPMLDLDDRLADLLGERHSDREPSVHDET